MAGAAREPLVVLDDDPTGVQTLAGIRVLLDWDPPRVRAALEGRPSVHLITNSRALPAEAVRAASSSPRPAPRSPASRRRERDPARRQHAARAPARGVPRVFATSSPPRTGAAAPARAGAPLRRSSHGRRRSTYSNGTAGACRCTRPSTPATASSPTPARLLAWADERSGGLFAPAAGASCRSTRFARAGPAAVADALLGPRRHGRPGGVRARRGDGRGPRRDRPRDIVRRPPSGAWCSSAALRRSRACSPRRRPRRSSRRPRTGRRPRRLRLVRAAITRQLVRSARRPAGIVVEADAVALAGTTQPARSPRGGRGRRSSWRRTVRGACDAPRAAGRDDEPRGRGPRRRGLARVVAAVAPSPCPASGRRAGSPPR